MVEAAPAEHRRLVVGLGVPVDLEDVQFGASTDPQDDHARPARHLRTVPLDGGAEHVDIEALQPVGVVGDDRNVVETVGEHGEDTRPAAPSPIGRDRLSRCSSRR